MSKSQVLLLKKWIADIKDPRFSSSGGIFYFAIFFKKSKVSPRSSFSIGIPPLW